MNTTKLISQELNISPTVVKNVLDLLHAEATVPFIARYRKEMTGNLDERLIYQIQKSQNRFDELEKRKKTILKALEEQGVLTDQLQQNIKETTDAVALEDIYLPYKKKRKTKAETARKNGLEPLAKIMMAQYSDDVYFEAGRFINAGIETAEAALEGARYIIAEWINENIWVRHFVRRLYQNSAILNSKVVKTKEMEEKAQKYLDYFDRQESLKRIPSHRLLAMLRGEKEGYLRLKLTVDTDFCITN